MGPYGTIAADADAHSQRTDDAGAGNCGVTRDREVIAAPEPFERQRVEANAIFDDASAAQEDMPTMTEDSPAAQKQWQSAASHAGGHQ